MNRGEMRRCLYPRLWVLLFLRKIYNGASDWPSILMATSLSLSLLRKIFVLKRSYVVLLYVELSMERMTTLGSVISPRDLSCSKPKQLWRVDQLLTCSSQQSWGWSTFKRVVIIGWGLVILILMITK